MKVIIFTRPDGGLSVMRPIVNIKEKITEDQAIERAWKNIPKNAINTRLVDESEIPSDRTYRNAWVDVSGKVVHDMEKCRELHREMLRELRKPKLEALDVAFLRALEQGLPTEAIVAEKKALRDVTEDPAIKAAATIEELKRVIPEILAPAGRVPEALP